MMAPNSVLRSTEWNGIPKEAATMRASRASEMLQQLFFEDSSAWTFTPFRMNIPISSWPWRCKSIATTELSTPPLMATTRRCLGLEFTPPS